MSGETVMIASAAAQAIFACVLAIATIALLFVTYKSAKATEKAANVAEKTLIDIERPYLFVEMVPPAWDAREFGNYFARPTTNRPMVYYRFRNDGRGPAIVRSRKDVFRYLPKLPDEPCFNLPGEPEELELGHIVSDPAWYMVIPPQGKGEQLGIVWGEMREQPTMAAIKGCGLVPCPIYVYGIVIYEDIFNQAHETNFCFELTFDPSDGKAMFLPFGGEAYHKRT
jgi:hypothetical protein